MSALWLATLPWLLGTVGHVGALHRARVGSLSDANAVDLETVENATPEERDRLLLPVASGLDGRT